MLNYSLNMKRLVFSLVGTSLISVTAFAGRLECVEKARSPDVYVTAESKDMSILKNLTFQFNKNNGSIMDYRSERDVEKSSGGGHSKKLKDSNSYQVESSGWVGGGSLDCSYSFFTQKNTGENFAGYLSAMCISGDGGVWKVEEDLVCKFE